MNQIIIQNNQIVLRALDKYLRLPIVLQVIMLPGG